LLCAWEDRKKLVSCKNEGSRRRCLSEDVDEIIEIRISLESLAAKWASRRISPAELERLEETIKLTEHYIEKNDTRGIVGLDTEFHDTICKASKSRRIEEILQTL
jgi:DNA-binding GntR family transcriptional regulator